MVRHLPITGGKVCVYDWCGISTVNARFDGNVAADGKTLRSLRDKAASTKQRKILQLCSAPIVDRILT
jgi:hypothetical protein